MHFDLRMHLKATKPAVPTVPFLPGSSALKMVRAFSMQNHAGITTGYESCASSAALCLERKTRVPSRDSDL